MDPVGRGLLLQGRYRVVAPLGEGAMASVYRGLDTQTGAEVAIKIMHPHLAQDPSFAGRFKREASAVSALKHPNSVNLLESGTEAGVSFLVMEFVPGENLKQLLIRERRLGLSRAAQIVCEVCRALEAAHDLGIIHRDLKPENIMVSQGPNGKEVVKVLDFGIAKLVDPENPARPKIAGEPDSSPVTKVGVVMGTPAYMSPEQVRALPLVDGRSDIYTCGILLYQLVTGHLPFDSPSPFELAGMQAFAAVPPPSIHVALPPGLEALILKALAKEPAARHTSARALREELEPHCGPSRAAPARGFGGTAPMLSTQDIRAALDLAVLPLGAAVATTGRHHETASAGEAPPQVVTQSAPVMVAPAPHFHPTAPMPRPLVAATDSVAQSGQGTKPALRSPSRALWLVCLVVALAAGMGIGVAVFQLLGTP